MIERCHETETGGADGGRRKIFSVDNEEESFLHKGTSASARSVAVRDAASLLDVSRRLVNSTPVVH